MSRYQVARLEEIEEIHDGRCPFRPVRHHFGLTTFGVNTWTARLAGDRLINDHDESDEVDGDELYLVLSGRARFEIDGDRVDASAGAFVAVPAGIGRTAFAEQPGTTLVAIGAGPGDKPYRPLGWEVWSPLQPLFAAGRHEEVLAQAAPLLQSESPYPLVLYNVACSETALGHVEDALGHLSRAVELMPEAADYARVDENLAALRAAQALPRSRVAADRDGRAINIRGVVRDRCGPLVDVAPGLSSPLETDVRQGMRRRITQRHLAILRSRVNPNASNRFSGPV